MIPVDAKSERFEEMELYDKRVLFSPLRIDRSTVPEGLHLYELRHGDDDWGDPVQVGKSVFVNHYGTILSPEPIKLDMLVMLDAILNRVIENHKRGKRTWVYIDEIYIFFKNEYSSEFLEESWKRFRKKGAAATGITQNVTDCLNSSTARNMLANSEFLLMLSQSPTDQKELVDLLHISETQLGFISNAEPGHGLMKVSGSLVPFVNRFPKTARLYNLINTKPGAE